MSPKHSPFAMPGAFGNKVSPRDLRRVDELIDNEEWDDARELLESLNRRHPNSPRILGGLLVAYAELGQHVLAVSTAEQLAARDPKGLSTLEMLLTTYMMATMPLHARDAAFRLASLEKSERTAELLALLEAAEPEVLEEAGLRADERDAALAQERAELKQDAGNFQAAIGEFLQIIQKWPAYAEPYLAAAHAYIELGEVDAAIDMVRRCLEQHPKSLGVTAEAIVIHFRGGRHEEGARLGAKLGPLVSVTNSRSASAPADSPEQLANAFMLLGDYESVLTVHDATELRIHNAIGPALQDGASDLPEPTVSPQLQHLAAVAHMLQGDVKRAKELLKAASADYGVAQDNLENLELPEGERDAPWPFPLSFWVPREAEIKFSAFASFDDASKMLAALLENVSQFPVLRDQAAMMLLHGDPPSRLRAIFIAEERPTPEVVETARELALGTFGTDMVRYRAAAVAVRHGELSADERHCLYRKGEPVEVRVLPYLFDWNISAHPKAVERLLEQTDELFESGRAQEARVLLRDGLRRLGPVKALFNQTLRSLYPASRSEKTDTIEELTAEHPDESSLRIFSAAVALESEGVEAAEAILAPYLEREKHHPDDLLALASLEVSIQVARGDILTARDWLMLIEFLFPKSGRLPGLRLLIEEAELHLIRRTEPRRRALPFTADILKRPSR